MTYLLDTNACIRYISGRSLRLRERIRDTPDTEMVVSSITKGEMFYGSVKSQTPKISRAIQDDFLRLFESMPFDDAAAEEYADIRVFLEMRGTPIGPHDMLIAAIARAKGLIVVTHNTKEFNRVPGLTIEDWEVD